MPEELNTESTLPVTDPAPENITLTNLVLFRAWQLFNYGFGPYNDGIFSQSSLGIVVKMGIWVGSLLESLVLAGHSQ